MTDPTLGIIDPDILNENVLSAILEFRVPMEEVGTLLEVLRRAASLATASSTPWDSRDEQTSCRRRRLWS